jgi:hypothetical protein
MPKQSLLGLFNGARHQGVSRLRSLVDGKRVAIVGNADSLFGRGLGAEIDQNDVIIRFNRGFVRDAESQGSRTDIIGTGQRLTLDQIDGQHGATFLYWLSPRWWRIPVWTRAKWQSVEVIPYWNWLSIKRELRLRPTSGYVMIRNLMKHTAPKEVNIYGFDFYATPNFYAKPRDVPNHDTDEEREKMLLHLSKRDEYKLHGVTFTS